MDIFSICAAAAWDIEFKQHEQEMALSDLESGRIIFCPQLSFDIEPSERMLFIPYLINKKTKNISFNLKKNYLKGIKADQKHQMCLKSMLARFSKQADYFRSFAASYKKLN